MNRQTDIQTDKCQGISPPPRFPTEIGRQIRKQMLNSRVGALTQTDQVLLSL